MDRAAMRLAGLSATTLLASLALAQPASQDLGSIGTPGTLTDNFSLASGQIKWYRFTLSAPINSPGNFLDIGTLSNAGTPVNTDTEIGLYRDDGTLVSNDDDSGPNQFSELSFGTTCPTRPSSQPPLPDGVALAGQSGATLPAGTYYLAVAGFNATFGTTAWNVTTTSTVTGEVRVFLTSDVQGPQPAPTFTAGAATPSGVLPGGTTLLTATAAACGSSGIAVTANLSALGGSATEPMFDDGTHGDVTAGNNVWSLSYTVPGAATPGPYNIVMTGTTAVAPAATRSVTLTVIGTPTYTEAEPNDTKAAANPIGTLAPGESLSGATTGTSTTTPGAASADYFKLKTVAAPLGIYKHRMSLETTGATGHTATIRGLSQSAGVIGTTDSTVQTGAIVGTARICQWYGFGKQEEVYYRVTGTTTTTGNYYSAYSRDPVTAISVPQDIASGSVIIDRDPSNTNTVDFWVYDSNFNPIATFGNESSNTMTRTFSPGTYYLAVSNVNTCNDQPSPVDSAGRAGVVMDFPNSIANSSTTTLPNMNMRFTYTGGSVIATGAKNSAFDVVFYQFNVVPPSNPGGIGSATPSSVAITGSTLLTVAVNGATNPPSTGLAVTADLSTINGSPTQAFYDDGSHGDVTAGDNTFSFQATLVEPQAPGARTLPFTVSDAQARSSSGTISLTATAAPTGRCCTASTCSIATQYNCTQGGGTYGGNGSDCGTVTYAFSDSATPYASISGTGTQLPTASNVDDGGETVAIPFTFNYYGTGYTSVWVCSNGFLQFGGANSTTFTNVAIPNTGIPNNMICPLWDDYNTATQGDIYWQVSGAAPTRTLTIDWANVTQYIGAGGTINSVNFECILYEGSNNIEFRYGQCDLCNATGQCTGTGGDGDDRTVGVENTDGTSGFSIGGASIGTGNVSKLVTFSQASPCAPACGTADFNCDGDVGTDADIEAFFACLAGTCPQPPCTNNADFNADGDVGTDADIESFFRVLSGGPC